MKALMGLLSIAVFVLLIFYIPKFFEEGTPLVCFEGEDCQHEEYLHTVIGYVLLLIILGFLIGILVSYFYFEKRIELPRVGADKKDNILLLLTPSERAVLKKIIDRNGEVLQSEVSRLEGMGKVRAHRVIEKLVRRGVLEKEGMGKTNTLKLRKEIRDAILGET